MHDQHQEYKVNNSIFLVELDKINPNPLQPRREFDDQKLKELAESIRQYGILQPLVVVRKEREVPTGTLVEYELVAGERRLRASKLAGLTQVPVIIRRESSDRIKLELALLENVQREDLNPIERAIAFRQLTNDFGLKQREVGEKMGKSREFVANSLRILSLPEEMQKALVEGAISEGHTRPLLMLTDRPEAQQILFKDIIYKKLSVRDAEKISRRIAHDRARKHDDMPDAATRGIEENLARTLGTRVTIERKGLGGVISISFFSDEELSEFLDKMSAARAANLPIPAIDEKKSDTPMETVNDFDVVMPEDDVMPMAQESPAEHGEMITHTVEAGIDLGQILKTLDSPTSEETEISVMNNNEAIAEAAVAVAKAEDDDITREALDKFVV
jgi:ParB family chromosome partitioning protein